MDRSCIGKSYNKKVETEQKKNQVRKLNKEFAKLIGSELVSQKLQFKCFVTPNRKTDFGQTISYQNSKFCPKRKSTATAGDIFTNIINNKSDCNIFIPTGFYTFEKFGNGKLTDVRCIMFDIDDIPEINDKNVKECDMMDVVTAKYPFLRKLPPEGILATGNKGCHLIYGFTNNLLYRKKDMEQVLSL